jgi:hypothetical protein
MVFGKNLFHFGNNSMSNGSGRNLASVKSITFNSPHLAMYQDT